RVEGPTDAGVDRHQDVQKHSHPRGGNMNEDDAVCVALLEVSWCDEEPDKQACSEEQGSGYPEPWDQLPRERVEHCWRCVFINVHNYSKDILSPADVAQGEKSNDTIANAPSNERCAEGLVPITLASTAPAPKINAGI